MGLMKNKKGQTDSVFKLALVVIIIAAVLAVVAYMMGSAWTGAGDIASSTTEATGTVEDSTNCMVTGTCTGAGPGS